ncbi:MAG: hypothetical protein KIS66_17780 [Fimbriimonadaceae bacterium]|nr:hypothetical protein [Fimbriimonadaceae bacterium]
MAETLRYDWECAEYYQEEASALDELTAWAKSLGWNILPRPKTAHAGGRPREIDLWIDDTCLRVEVEPKARRAEAALRLQGQPSHRQARVVRRPGPSPWCVEVDGTTVSRRWSPDTLAWLHRVLTE